MFKSFLNHVKRFFGIPVLDINSLAINPTFEPLNLTLDLSQDDVLLRTPAIQNLNNVNSVHEAIRHMVAQEEAQRPALLRALEAILQQRINQQINIQDVILQAQAPVHHPGVPGGNNGFVFFNPQQQAPHPAPVIAHNNPQRMIG